MKIELKSLKISRALSEETTAFTAKIAIDGVVVGDVRNDGNGGCHMVHVDPEHRAAFEVEAERLFPAKEGAKYHNSEEDLINDLLEQAEDAKVMKSFAKKGLPRAVKVWRNKQMIGDFEYYDDVFIVGYVNESQLAGILAREKAEKHKVIA